MIHARFGDTTGRAFIEALLIIPEIHVRGPVSFLYDSGADHSVLMPTDTGRLNIDLTKFTRTCVSVGLGGKSVSHASKAILLFTDPGIAVYTYEIDLLVKAENHDLDRVPSLLGRDVTDRWKIACHGEMKHFSAEPLSYDHKFELLK
ncbi:MAG TPA: hypothetical protein VHZ29_13130 [Rhizomicrobium sp.]|jgi:hypothetical protein|nr:hypothetical protein [Rhizomicrobium sp.]